MLPLVILTTLRHFIKANDPIAKTNKKKERKIKNKRKGNFPDAKKIKNVKYVDHVS